MESELNHIRNDKTRLKIIRSRLSDISWWMRLLSQNIAQRANKEDGELGKFWQARYRAVRLLDMTAILACAAYVDRNPIRAALAETIEDSDFTSAQKRCCDIQSRHAAGSKSLKGEPIPSKTAAAESTVVGATVVGATVVGATVVGATVVGATVVGATVVGATVVGATVVGATVVGATVVGATVVGAAVEASRRSSRHLAPVELQGGSSTTGPCVHRQGGAL